MKKTADVQKTRKSKYLLNNNNSPIIVTEEIRRLGRKQKDERMTL